MCRSWFRSWSTIILKSAMILESRNRPGRRSVSSLYFWSISSSRQKQPEKCQVGQNHFAPIFLVIENIVRWLVFTLDYCCYVKGGIVFSPKWQPKIISRLTDCFNLVTIEDIFFLGLFCSKVQYKTTSCQGRDFTDSSSPIPIPFLNPYSLVRNVMTRTDRKAMLFSWCLGQPWQKTPYKTPNIA